MYHATAVVKKLWERLFDGSRGGINAWGQRAVSGTARWNYTWQKCIYKHQSKIHDDMGTLQILQ